MSVDTVEKFPDCINQGLIELEKILKLPHSTHIHKVQTQIIEENVFMLQDTPKCSKVLSPIEELVLVRSVAEYLAHISDPGIRNILFITLFPVATNEPPNGIKSRVLSSLISLAVATHNVAVLNATAVWMQQVSCFSTRCCRVSFVLVQDFFHKANETPEHFVKALNALPGAATLFTAHLITSLSQVYSKVDTKELCDEPPFHVVRIVIQWLQKHRLLILAPLTTTLPGISLPMIAVISIAPLAKWCIEAPFFSTSKENSTFQDPFSELHLILLQTLQAVSSIRARMTQREVINAEHLKNIAESLNIRLQDPSYPDNAKETAVNRLTQLVLVAIHTECLTGRVAEMWNSFKKLPTSHTRLMKILLSKCGVR